MSSSSRDFGRKKEDAGHWLCSLLFGERGGSAPIAGDPGVFGPAKEEVSDEGKEESAVRGVFICQARVEARTKRYGIWHRCPWDIKSSRRKSMYSTTSAAKPSSRLSFSRSLA